jgi:hypothetical protein
MRQPRHHSHRPHHCTTHSAEAHSLAMQKVFCLWRQPSRTNIAQGSRKNGPVKRHYPVLVLLWLLYESLTFRSQQTANVGAPENLPWLAISHQTVASHRPQLGAAVASLPPRLRHPHMRVANEGAREDPSAAAARRSHWSRCGGSTTGPGIGAQGRGQPYMLSGFSGIFSPVIIAVAVPPFATIAGPHSFIDPSRSDDARG